MKVIVKSHMFYVYDAHGNEKACFKSFTRLAEYLVLINQVSLSVEVV